MIYKFCTSFLQVQRDIVSLENLVKWIGRWTQDQEVWVLIFTAGHV